jgi:uracil-DNA glycosylase
VEKEKKTGEQTAEDFLPPDKSLPSLREAARHCEGCDLYKHATQVVFGNGPSRAKLMFVGEQPGDQEDLQGQPFIGPAGKLLRQFMVEAKLNIEEAYVTNAVKHFGFQEKGGHRLHATPRIIDINACNAWLEAEVAAVQPEIIVCLGVSATQAVFGKKLTISKSRGVLMESRFGNAAYVTVHPSSLLRIPDEAAKQEARALFLQDLKKLATLIKK